MPCENNGPSPSYYTEWQNAERALCGLRWLVLRIADETPGVAEKWDAFLPTIRADHLRHRREDRDDIVRRAIGDLHALENTSEMIRRLGGEPAPHFLERRKKLEADITRFGAMTDEELGSTKWRTVDEMP